MKSVSFDSTNATCGAIFVALGVFFAALIASFASQKMRPPMAVALSFGITVFSVAVFSYGLGLPFERFGPWVRF